MSSFTDELASVLQRLTGRPAKRNDSGIFPVFNISGIKISVQAIDTDTFNLKEPEPDFFRQQCLKYEAQKEQIIHCWEDLWYSKQSIVISRLESIFGESTSVHGRKCRIEDISQKEMSNFLESNHLVGVAKGKYRYGLFHNSELMAVALFARSVPVQREEGTFQSHEMIRFCNRLGYYVQGGLSKLMSHFIREVNPDDIYTVVDRDWSDGKAFLKLGFTIVGETEPIRFWLDADGERIRYQPEPRSPSVINSGNIKLLLRLKGE